LKNPVELVRLVSNPNIEYLPAIALAQASRAGRNPKQYQNSKFKSPKRNPTVAVNGLNK
jgi:hypothetical protein